MSKINNSFDDMFKKYRLILNLKYLDRIFTDPAVHQDFYNKIKKNRISGISEETFVKEYFRTHSQYIDREAYIFYTLKTIQEELGELSYIEIAENCKKALKNSIFEHYEVRKTRDGKNVEIARVTAKDLLGESQKDDNAQRLEKWNEAKKYITPISFFSYTSNTELAQYCNNPTLATLITRMNFINVVDRFYKLSVAEKINFLEGNDIERLEKLTRECADKLDFNSEEITCFYKAIPEYMERYPNAFDFDKAFLIAAFKANEFLEGTNLSKDENEKYTELFKRSMAAIKRRGTKVENIVSFVQPSGKSNISYKELETLLNNITPSGYYVSKAEKRDILDRIFVKEGRLVALMEEDPEKLRVLDIKDNEYEELLTEEGILAFITLTNLCSNDLIQKKYKNMEIPEFDLEILVKANFFKPEEVLDYCAKKESIGPDLFNVLNEKGLLNAQTKIDFFIAGKFDFEMLERLSNEEKNEIREKIEPERLITLFKSRNDSEEKEKAYNNYLRLYRNFKLMKISKEDRLKLDEQIVEALGEDLDDETLKKLYKSHIISFKTLKDWVGTNIISNMMEKTEIKPEDVKEMCADGEYETLFAVLGNPNIPKSRKMAIFRTSFANIDYELLGEEEKENLVLARDEALRLINLKDEKTFSKGQVQGTKRKKGNGKRFNEYTSDPQLRWDLIDLMGDYSYEMLDQGMCIFKFPRFRGGTIVLEKMYKKDKPEYGRATKIINMSIEDFEKIKSDIIDNDDIPPFLVDTHPALQGKITNISHSTAWGRQFAEYFEQDLGEPRTPEEIGKIERKIQSILNSRELR